MGVYSVLNVKPYIGKIRLNPQPEIKPVKLNIRKDFLDCDNLNDEYFSVINSINKELEEFAENSRKRYEQFVLSELHSRGYDLLRLENLHCWRRTTPGIGDWDREEFYADDMLVLTVKKRTRFEDAEHRYMIYTDFQIETNCKTRTNQNSQFV